MDTALRMLLFEDPRSLASVSYSQKILDLLPANLIAYWRLNEASGANADNHEGTAARDGTYTGVTLGQTGIGDGLTVPLFDGANDFVNVHSASFNTAFDGAEGSIVMWMQVRELAVWSDATHRSVFQFRVNDQNRLSFRKTNINNRVSFFREANDVISFLDIDGQSDTDFLSVGITWSEAADEMRAYIDGVQVGATQTGLGAWTGNLAATETCIGSETTVPARPWDGQLGHVPVWNTPLSPALMLEAGTL